MELSKNSEYWSPLALGFLKLNCDSVFLHDGHLSTCGGVIRDDNGSFVQAFSHCYGHVSILEAELCDITWRFRIVTSRNILLVEVEFDSLLRVNLISSGCYY